MTSLFVLFALTIAALTYNLFRPVCFHAGLSVMSFLAGWLVGELALHHILLQVAVTSLFAWTGAITGLAGTIGLVICVASWVAMAWFYATSEQARTRMQQALNAALGQNYEAVISQDLRHGLASEPDYRLIRNPLLSLDPAVEAIKNLAFGDHRQRLDIYRSGPALPDRPVLLQIHGGAWTEHMGSKNHQAIPLMSHMALRGWICVSINYRLSPSATFPAHIIDCKQGLAWIKANIRDYGGNPDFVAVTGGSAGGHLCSLLALTANAPAYQPGFEDIDTDVRAAVPFYGVFDFTNAQALQTHAGLSRLLEDSVMKMPLAGNPGAYQAASPLYRIHPGAPPFLIIHGDHDSLVPIAEARHFSDRLRAVSRQPVACAEIPGAQHAFDMFPSLRSEHVKHGVDRFLTYIYSQYRQGQLADPLATGITPDGAFY